MPTKKTTTKKTATKKTTPKAAPKKVEAKPTCDHSWVSNIGGESRYVCGKCGEKSD